MSVLIVFLFSFSASAENWFPFGKVGANRTYSKSKEQCEKAESAPCFEITDKDLRRYVRAGNRLVLDPVKSAQADAEDSAKEAEQAAEVDRLDKLDKAKRQYCRKQNKNNLEKILCAEWKREAIEDQ
jgi:hypothetical protein